MDSETNNPFWDNHIFTKEDLKRLEHKKISMWEFPFLYFRTTYVQLNDGYVFYYKHSGGRYFLMRAEKQIERQGK